MATRNTQTVKVALTAGGTANTRVTQVVKVVIATVSAVGSSNAPMLRGMI